MSFAVPAGELVLHHYPMSPFAEKVRLVLGAKRLAWRSVHIPVVMPKPDVVALTGGYRKTPVLQIGADIYCDTALICRVLDARAPEPTLYPRAIDGAAQLLAQWADATLFWAAVPYALQPGTAPEVFGKLPPEQIKAFAVDRAALRPNALRPNFLDAGVALRHHLGWLESLFADGRSHLAGTALSIADFAVAHPLWFVHRVPSLRAEIDAHPHLRAWLEAMLAFGNGDATPMTSTEAIELAASSVERAPVEVEPGLGFDAGADVTVTPTDYGFDPVAGRLVGLSRDSVTVERRDDRAGTLQVHFPRIGFQIRKQETKP
ncbi:MAG TPA: glutathione S-transferase family protein [Methylibium sp.]|uniref:glutathione S-transferase family protein n=1 Tax=Methylibium sp. TaxID=2067992 RepID=UPI002DBECC3F|nr:glutathione S-transferase family protein [Methylibium sp.]HEU4460657.1 glutathione S-transferase family protein [Methylibium sp.]